MVAALVLAGFVFLPPERLIQRLARFVSTDGLTSDGRTDLWAETIPLIRGVSGLRLRAWWVRDCILKVQDIRSARNG